MEREIMLTTVDNPFDPFDDFTSWLDYDLEKGHFTCARLARLANINSEMTQKEMDDEMERVIDFIIKHDLEEKFIKVQEKQSATATNTPTMM